MSGILWLTPSKPYSSGMLYALEKYYKAVNLKPQDFFYFSLHAKVEDFTQTRGKKQVVTFNPLATNAATNALDKIIAQTRPKIIVCNDTPSLQFITDNTKYVLGTVRGSVYFYRDIPVLIVDDFYKLYTVDSGKWVFTQDLQKLERWYNGRQRQEPKFSYTVCHTVADVERAKEWIIRSPGIAEDIETTARFINCIGFTGVVDGKLHTYVIPFFNPTKPGNNHWQDERDHVRVWQLVRDIHACPATKIMQNGGNYDAAYFIFYRLGIFNYLVDTMHLWHSLYPLAPKKLNFISSILLDYYRFWKDEIKGEEDKSVRDAVNDLERFWRYNALDCYNTFLNARILIQLYRGIDWMRTNYQVEFEGQIGPALAMSMRGMKLHEGRRQLMIAERGNEADEELKKLKKMVDDPDFNPGSDDQVAKLVYQTFGFEGLKFKAKTLGSTEFPTDEKTLTFAKRHHPLLARIIDSIWVVKKGRNFKSNFSKQLGFNGRFHYGYGTAGTAFGRYNSKNHPLWVGRNAQNWADKIRSMCIADRDGFFAELDYSQSDAKFVAFECQDPRYIAVFESGKDTHSYHASVLYNRSYEEILLAAQNKEEWCVHPTKGVRQNTKRAVHGTNFQMAASTLFAVMGYDAVVASMHALGFKDAHFWEDKKLIKHVELYLQERYHKLYPMLREWFKETTLNAIKNGNKVTVAFGKTILFFGDILENKDTQRAISSAYGQGGTAGNINRCLNDIYWNSDIESRGALLLFQGHDSMLFWVPKNKPELVDEVLTIMEKPFIIKGRTLHIPAEAKVGLSWGSSSSVSWKGAKEFDWNKLVAAERKLQASFDARKLKLDQAVEEQIEWLQRMDIQLSGLTLR